MNPSSRYFSGGYPPAVLSSAAYDRPRSASVTQASASSAEASSSIGTFVEQPISGDPVDATLALAQVRLVDVLRAHFLATDASCECPDCEAFRTLDDVRRQRTARLEGRRS